jgi:hypothetical protein
LKICAPECRANAEPSGQSFCKRYKHPAVVLARLLRLLQYFSSNILRCDSHQPASFPYPPPPPFLKVVDKVVDSLLLQ